MANGDDGQGIFLEIGANIGACTIQMLLSTNATVAVFEPSPLNLHYLTSSLSWLQTDGRLRSGAVVFPLALGDETKTALLFEQHRNSGNSVIGAREMAGETNWTVLIRRLDDLIMPFKAQRHTRRIRLAKIDAQGYECKLLAGMRRFLAKHVIELVHFEVAVPHLEAQGCSELGLYAEIWRAKYAVHKRADGMTAVAWPVEHMTA